MIRATAIMKLASFYILNSQLSMMLQRIFTIALLLLTVAFAACTRNIEADKPVPIESDLSSQNESQNSDVVTRGRQIKCSTISNKEDRLICNSVISPAYREDAVSFEAFEITVADIDLNGDKVNELIVWESSWAGTSGGSLWALSKMGNRYRKIFETDMTWTPITVLSTTHHKWSDFSYFVNGGGVEPVFVTVSFNGKSYEDRSFVEQVQPKGEILIEKHLEQSTFGPISANSTP